MDVRMKKEDLIQRFVISEQKSVHMPSWMILGFYQALGLENRNFSSAKKVIIIFWNSYKISLVLKKDGFKEAGRFGAPFTYRTNENDQKVGIYIYRGHSIK